MQTALTRADNALWERIKAEPDERARLLAQADCLAVVGDELNALVSELLYGNR